MWYDEWWEIAGSVYATIITNQSSKQAHCSLFVINDNID